MQGTTPGVFLLVCPAINWLAPPLAARGQKAQENPSSFPSAPQATTAAATGDGEWELCLLTTFCKAAKHFRVQRVLGAGANGIVFAVQCTHREAPFPDKTYALKVRRVPACLPPPPPLPASR